MLRSALLYKDAVFRSARRKRAFPKYKRRFTMMKLVGDARSTHATFAQLYSIEIVRWKLLVK
jgi:hypothetical protein